MQSFYISFINQVKHLPDNNNIMDVILIFQWVTTLPACLRLKRKPAYGEKSLRTKKKVLDRKNTNRKTFCNQVKISAIEGNKFLIGEKSAIEEKN